MPNLTTIYLPDIGDFDAVEVIEVLVAVGDEIKSDDSIITLESDKASMEIPAPNSGIVKEIRVKLGDKISQGEEILKLEIIANNADYLSSAKETKPPQGQKNADTLAPKKETHSEVVNVIPQKDFHASPSIRKLARELGVDLAFVVGTGTKGRILEGDVKTFVKQTLTSQSSIPHTNIAEIDFSKFGEVHIKELSRINKISAKHLHSSWLNIPHVSQFDEADITELEEFRQTQKAKGVHLTPLVFVMKAVAGTLKRNPRFNASLSADGTSLIIKKYINLGIAIDTPDGLIVPVVRDVDKKSVLELAEELTNLSKKARNKKLSLADLQGGCFSISSLGGIGGKQFTPIINAPEVAILGISRHQMKPVFSDGSFVPKLMLPLVLSYDHRVIDGAQGVRFITDLSQRLTDIREILL